MKLILILASFFIQISIFSQTVTSAPATSKSNYAGTDNGQGETENDLLFSPEEFLPDNYKTESSTILSLNTVSTNIEINNTTDYLVREFVSEFENAKSYHLLEKDFVIMELVNGKKLQFPVHISNNEQIEFIYNIKSITNESILINISLDK